MSLVDVCRLCLSKENLVWVFDKRFQSSENLKDVIYVTTGVEIADTDLITQKICEKCHQVTTKILEFRRTSLKNDHYLREQCKRILRDEPFKITNTNVAIQNCVPTTLSEKPVENDKTELQPAYEIHPSVRDLFQVYPQIKLHNVCLGSHIAPAVCIDLDAVETYFKVHKLDIVEHTKLTLANMATPQPASSNKDLPPPKAKIGPASKMAESSTHPFVILDNNVKPCERDTSVDTNFALQEKSSGDVTPEEAPAVKKIKLSEDWETAKKEAPKQNVIEPSSLVPQSSSIESPTTMPYVTNTSVPLHICNICNSVQYSANDLQMHQLKHLRCQFCRLECRSLEQKMLHIETDCVIKNTMHNLPNVYLDKIEFNLQVRRRYPEAFIEFPVIKDMYDVENSPSEMESSDSEADDDLICLDSPDDYEDIGFDTEELPLAVNKDPLRDNSVGECKIPPEDSTTQESTAPPKDSTAKSKPSADDNVEIISDDEGKASASNASASQSKVFIVVDKGVHGKLPLPPLIPIARPAPVVRLELPAKEKAVCATVSVKKQNINDRAAAILNNMDRSMSDRRMFKDLLLTNFKMSQYLRVKRVQTGLSSGRAITVNRSEMIADLRCLKQELYAHMVPVIIKNGPFNVSYINRKEPKREKNLCLWNDLTPIDLKRTRIHLPVCRRANANLAVSKHANVILPASSRTKVSLPVPSSADVNLPVSRRANVILPVSSRAKVSLPVPSSADVNLPVSRSANVNSPVSSRAKASLPVPSSADVNLPVSRSANADLPVSRRANVNLPVSRSAKVNLLISDSTNIVSQMPNSNNASLPVCSSVNAVTSQNSSDQKNVACLPSVASHNSFRVLRLPGQTDATTSIYVCKTKPKANSTRNSAARTANIVKVYPMVHKYLEVQGASATAPEPTTSHVDTDNEMPASGIRVKNVWELT